MAIKPHAITAERPCQKPWALCQKRRSGSWPTSAGESSSDIGLTSVGPGEHRQSEEGRVRAQHDSDWNLRKVVPKPPLGLKPFAKLRATEMFDDPRDDAAADEDATARTEKQGDVSGNGAQQATKRIECLSARGAGAIERRLRYLCGSSGDDVDSVDHRGRPIEIDQSVAGQGPLRRCVSKLPA